MKLAGLKSIENAHDESVWAAAWVPATESRPALLLTGSLDETVKLWMPDELVLQQNNTGHCLGVVAVAAHPSGIIAASASLDSFVRVFDVDTNATIATLEAPPSEVWQMQFDPKVRLLWTLLQFSCYMWFVSWSCFCLWIFVELSCCCCWYFCLMIWLIAVKNSWSCCWCFFFKLSFTDTFIIKPRIWKGESFYTYLISLLLFFSFV